MASIIDECEVLKERCMYFENRYDREVVRLAKTNHL